MSKRYLFVSFVTGFVLMVFEMVAARLMSPVVGGSSFVWASIIGVIIAAMSLGYFVGGFLADKQGKASNLVWLLHLTALLILLTTYQHAWLFELSNSWGVDVRLQATITAMALFAPTSFMLGVISPYLVKLQVKSLENTGQSVASLSALNSMGGIIGTFVAGFFLFGWIGSRESLVILIALLISASWTISPRDNWKRRLVFSLVFLGLALASVVNIDRPQPLSIDTATAHYTIKEWTSSRGDTIRGISSGPNGIQSGISVQSPDELVFWYTREMAKIVDIAPQKQNILVLGGGTFTLPRHLAKKYTDSQIDVVEIDKGLLPIARQYFSYNDPPNIKIHFEDARTLLNKTEEKYDIILVDVYNDSEVPFVLTTKEYSQSLEKHLKDSSIVIANMIASKQQGCLGLFSALDSPYSAILRDSRYVFQNPLGNRISNLVAVYGNDLSDFSASPLVKYSFDNQLLFTDNFAPTERLNKQCMDENPII